MRTNRGSFFVLLALGLLASSACDGEPAPDAGSDGGPCVDGATSEGEHGTTWVTVCGGSFEMGSTAFDQDNEQPVHTVTVPDVELLQTEVTVSQYAGCIDAGVCTAPSDSFDYCSAAERGNWGVSGREEHPLNCVTWVQATAFCQWIGGRLPTEAEWEYAARSGGQEIHYPWGDATATCEYAVMISDGWGCGTTHTLAVASKPAGNTAQGLNDMAGNLWEWCQDTFHESYSGAPTDGSAWEDTSTDFRVLRGGGMESLADMVRTEIRGNEPATRGHVAGGIRCAR